jgi:hypothetical protein
MNVVVCGFADELKDTVFRLYSWAGVKRKEHYENCPEDRETILPALGISYRQLLINIGNHMRQYDNLVWTRAVLTKPGIDVLIIKDCRFPQEASMIKTLGGHVVKVERDSIPHDADGADDPLADYTGWDYIVKNNGDLNTLNGFADYLVQTFKLGD